MKEIYDDFSGGLALDVPRNRVPKGMCSRNDGIHPDSLGSFVLRRGTSSKLVESAVLALSFFNDSYVYNKPGSTSLERYEDVLEQTIRSDCGSSRLNMHLMPPTAGKLDNLFVVDPVEDQMYKLPNTMFSGEHVTNGDMEIDDNWTAVGTPTTEEQSTDQKNGGTYSWKFIVDAQNEGIQSDDFTTITGRTYFYSFYVYSANTTVNIIIRKGDDSGDLVDISSSAFTASTWSRVTGTFTETAGGAGAYIQINSDTGDSSGTYYVDDVSVQLITTYQGWGIDSPTNTGFSLADAAVAGNPNGTYKYKITYKNSKTGTRSNPNGDDDTLSLLLHLDNNVTDASSWTHTVSNVNAAGFDAVNQKFGTHAIDLEEGDSDHLLISAHPSLSFSDGTFTIDCWARYEAVTGARYTMFGSWEDADNWWYAHFYIKTVGSFADFRVMRNGVEEIYTTTFADAGVSAPTVDTQYHQAIIRGWGGNPNQIAMTFGGEVVLSFTFSGGLPSGSCYIGAAAAGAGPTVLRYMNGLIDEFRIMKEVVLWTENFTPPVLASVVDSSVSVETNQITVAGIPTSDDAQVDTVELWRTVGNASTFYKLDEVANGVTTYTDDIGDLYLSSTVLPLDNIKPYQYFTDFYGPHNASCFWITTTEEGQRGRLFYSAIGRMEAMEGFINVTNDEDGLQKVVEWAGNLGVLSKSGAFQILGTNPYFSRPLKGVPGTTNPRTVVATPIGIIYQANDGIYLFNGTTAVRISLGINKLFTGTTIEGIAAFTGVDAVYARNEYLITDGANILAYHITNKTWRHLSINVFGLFYDDENDDLLACFATYVGSLEDNTTNDDNTTAIPITLQPHAIRPAEVKTLLKRITIEYNQTAGTAVHLYSVIDNSATDLGAVTTGSQLTTNFPVNKWGYEHTFRVDGDVDGSLEIFRAELDIHIPKETEE